MEKDADGGCVTSRSVTHFTSGVNDPHHFQKMLCGRSEPALSQPQLYHFKSLALELFVYRLRSIDYTAKIKDWRLKYGTHKLKRELCFSLWGDAFSAQGCHLVVLRLKKKKQMMHLCCCIHHCGVKRSPSSSPPLDSEVGLSFTQL